MFDDNLKTAVMENGGSVVGLLAASAGAFWGLWKLLPVFNNNLDNAAKAGAIQGEMLTLLQKERDTALAQLEVLRDKYDALFKDWSILNAQLSAMQEKVTAMQRELSEANSCVERLKARVETASSALDSAAAPSALPEEGNHHE